MSNVSAQYLFGKKLRENRYNPYLFYSLSHPLLLCQNIKKKLKDIFVREEEYVSDLKDNKKKRMKIKVYRTLPIRSSMFYRIKNKILLTFSLYYFSCSFNTPSVFYLFFLKDISFYIE